MIINHNNPNHPNNHEIGMYPDTLQPVLSQLGALGLVPHVTANVTWGVENDPTVEASEGIDRITILDQILWI